MEPEAAQNGYSSAGKDEDDSDDSDDTDDEEIDTPMDDDDDFLTRELGEDWG